MPEYSLHADINPVPWKAPTLGTRRINGKMVPSASPNEEMHTYQEALREQWEPLWNDDPLTCAVELTWRFSRRLNTYQSATGRSITKKICDLSNLVKSSEDAIQPWLIANDNQVWRFSAEWAEAQNKTATPGIWLTIKPVEWL